ncbi:ABC transporter substrate-binding protein [Streptomyces armeniacus]|uniref:ABC transporter substrate-binding protein n=1 Tax=Streptomyces armeniacus TaxID=83291 RepID=A0A345XTM8_9ACTN|nr:ABC transporter substrate-binding protein [Streptomyces armeniacus]AXK34994.1 ABC transporter substrate-binding protein [Streptomyces armeniacus]
MDTDSFWTFRDDRGREVTAPRRPRRIVAYVPAAAAALQHLGVTVAGIYGSPHDKDGLDPVKADGLSSADVAYLGAGTDLTAPAVLAAEPDLFVSVTYDGTRVYGVEPGVVEELEAAVPTVALAVGPGHRLLSVRDRFGELARALGTGGGHGGTGAADAEAEQLSASRLRTVARRAAHVRVLALSPADPERAHVARPGAWPDLQELAEAGLRLPDVEGPGANWATLGWDEVAALDPDVVLTDVRSNAVPVTELESVAGWRSVRTRAAVVPWNPELPCTSRAISDFLDAVARAVERKGRELAP